MTISSAAAEPSVSSVRRARTLLALGAAAAVLLYWVYVDVVRPLPTSARCPGIHRDRFVVCAACEVTANRPELPTALRGNAEPGGELLQDPVAIRIPSQEPIVRRQSVKSQSR
jgi:hypothetical protein